MPDPARLSLQQWLSPAFPTGAFAYSHGLEQVVADGAVHDAASLRAWLATVLEHGAGWQDAVLLAQGLRRGADFAALDDLARALQSSAGRLRETTEQGAAFARTVSALTGRALPPRALPVALAEAAAPLGLPAPEVIAASLQAFATNLTGIGIRHIPLGQSEGHRVLAGLLTLIAVLAERAATAGQAALYTSVPAADLAAMAHETLQPRLFRT